MSSDAVHGSVVMAMQLVCFCKTGIEEKTCFPQKSTTNGGLAMASIQRTASTFPRLLLEFCMIT
jgi:hypothetical protein